MIIGDEGLLGFRGYYSYESSDFKPELLTDSLKKIIKKLESKNIIVLEASEAFYEDEYPRLYIVIKEVDKVIDNILEIEDFDIQVFRNEEDYSKAVIIIERHFLKDEYTEKEFDKKQDELINNLNNWIKIN